MCITHRPVPVLVALAASAALLAPAAALASTNRTGLPMYPGAVNAFAPDADAQFTCHEYHAATADAASTVVAWYHSRYPRAHMKKTKFGFFDNSTIFAIGPTQEIVVSPPNKSSTQTQIVLYGGTQCPIL